MHNYKCTHLNSSFKQTRACCIRFKLLCMHYLLTSAFCIRVIFKVYFHSVLVCLVGHSSAIDCLESRDALIIGIGCLSAVLPIIGISRLVR